MENTKHEAAFEVNKLLRVLAFREPWKTVFATSLSFVYSGDPFEAALK
jgi:hypothetical protein